MDAQAAVFVGLAIAALIKIRKTSPTTQKHEYKEYARVYGVIGGIGPAATASFFSDGILGGRQRLFQALHGEKELDDVVMCEYTEEEKKKVYEQTIVSDLYKVHYSLCLLAVALGKSCPPIPLARTPPNTTNIRFPPPNSNPSPLVFHVPQPH